MSKVKPKDIPLKNEEKDIYNYVTEEIIKNTLNPKLFRWLKKDSNYESHSDLCFIYKGNVYSVIIDIQNKKGESSLSGEKIEQQISASEKYKFIACTYPVTVSKSGTISAKTESWNLFDAKTNEELNPDNIKRDKDADISILLLQYHGINYVRDYLSSKKNKILEVQYLTEDEPNIWYQDKTGNKSYVIVRYENLKNLYQNDVEIVGKYKQNSGHEAIIKYRISDKSSSKGDLSLILNDFVIINTPEIDILTKCDNIEQENVYDLIVRAIQQKNISDKESIGVFPIPGYRDFLLKINNVFANNLGLLSKDLAIIPYEFADEIKNNSHYGIPLYHIDSKYSEYAEAGIVDPASIIFVGIDYAGISIIKKVKGEGVKKKYDSYLSLLNGKVTDDSAAVDTLKMIDIYCKYGIGASEKALNKVSKSIYEIEENELANNSIKYSFVPNDGFYSTYKLFLDNYMYTLKSISELPQKSFDEAVENIMRPKNFVFDFVIPNNTLIDYEKQEFNFIDFRYEKFKVSHTNSSDQILEFRNVLLGQYNRITRQANQLLFRQSDVDKYNYYKNIITEKIKNATPKI